MNSNNVNQDVHYESKLRRNFQAEIMYDNLGRSSNSIKGFIITNGTSDLMDIALLNPFEAINNDIIIPGEYRHTDGNYYPILAIDSHAFEGAFFDSLIIEYSEEEIALGFGAFEFTQSLSSNGEMSVIINRPIVYKELKEETKELETDNIFVASSLNYIVLPKSCNIASNMFSACEFLENIFFSEPYNYKAEQKDEVKELKSKLTKLIDNSEGVVTISEDVYSIGESAFDGTINISKLHLSGDIRKVGATILTGWENSQFVYVDNDAPIKYKNDKDSEGWHPQWNSQFTNITYKNEYYKIYFEAGDYKLNYDKDYIEVIYGQAVGILPDVNIETYKIFNGWYYDGNLISADTIFNFKHDITVIPDVKYKDFCVTLNSEGGTNGTPYVNVKYGEAFPEAVQPTKTGWKFNGYFSEKNGRGVKYYDSTDEVNGIMRSVNVSNFINDSTIYAYWTEIQTVIKYELAGGKNNSENPVSIRYSDNAIELKDATKDGYVFEGWYLNGIKITSIFRRTEEEILLVAKWASCLDAPVMSIDSSANNIILTGRSVYKIKLPTSNQVMHFEIYSDVKQVYIFSENYREYGMYITIKSRNTDIDLHLENFIMSAPNMRMSTGGYKALSAITMETSNNSALRLYTYGTVKINGASGWDNMSGTGKNGNYAINCAHLIIECADNLTITGGDGGLGKVNGKGAAPVHADKITNRNLANLINGIGNGVLA